METPAWSAAFIAAESINGSMPAPALQRLLRQPVTGGEKGGICSPGIPDTAGGILRYGFPCGTEAADRRRPHPSASAPRPASLPTCGSTERSGTSGKSTAERAMAAVRRTQPRETGPGRFRFSCNSPWSGACGSDCQETGRTGKRSREGKRVLQSAGCLLQGKSEGRRNGEKTGVPGIQAACPGGRSALEGAVVPHCRRGI